MVPTLRVWHRRIWLTLAIALPLMFIAAVMAIEYPRTDTLAGAIETPALPLIKGKGQSELMDVVFRTTPVDTVSQQLEIRLKKALAAPESLIYLDDSHSSFLIGRLTTRGLHRYDISGIRLSDSTRLSVRLLDPIKQAAITIVHLQKP